MVVASCPAATCCQLRRASCGRTSGRHPGHGVPPPESWAWRLCAAGQHLASHTVPGAKGPNTTYSCVGPDATTDGGSVNPEVQALELGVPYVFSWVALCCLFRIRWKREEREQARWPTPSVVSFTWSAAQPPPVTNYSTEDPVGPRFNDESATSRSFVASAPAWGSKSAAKMAAGMSDKWTSTYGWLATLGLAAAMLTFVYVFTLLPDVTRALSGGSHLAPPVLRYAGPFLGALLVAGILAYLGWYQRRKIIVRVTSDGLTIDRRPRDVFSLVDAKLGRWGAGSMTVGTALRLQCGPHQFILGGRDHRIPTGTRLEAPPAGYVDASMSASNFDELLTMVGRRRRLDIPRPARGGAPTRCLLFPNPELIDNMSMWAVGSKQRLMRSAVQPLLALDVGDDAIRVIDPNNNVLIARAGPAQVTAAPETYTGRPWRKIYRRTPVLVVRVPGWQSLTVGCRDGVGFAGQTPRFSWRGKVPDRNEPAAYSVTAADWLTLVEKCGLSLYLETHEK